MKTRFVLPALFSVALSASAFAQSFQSFDATFDYPAPGLFGPENFTDPISLPKFNSDLGTLQAVKLTITSSFAGEDYIENPNNSSPTQVTATVGELVDLSDSNGNDLFYALPTGSTSVTVNLGGATVPISGNGSASMNATNLSPYETAGGGLLNFDVNGNMFVESYTAGPFDAAPDVGISGDVNIDYTYAAIPEPSTYAVVVGLAVLGFAAIRRKRQVA